MATYALPYTNVLDVPALSLLGNPAASTGDARSLTLAATGGSWAFDSGLNTLTLTVASGLDGSVWYSDAGVPDNGIGVNGDFYLNETNGDVYEKAAGTWTVTANIKGLQGDQGIQGVQSQPMLPRLAVQRES